LLNNFFTLWIIRVPVFTYINTYWILFRSRLNLTTIIHIQKRLSKANTIYLGINTDDVVETFSIHMQGFYLVNVGKFHNVWNKDDDRYCLSACLIDSVNGRRLSFTELQNRLKDYIDD
jgi:hypothetical protein